MAAGTPVYPEDVAGGDGDIEEAPAGLVQFESGESEEGGDLVLDEEQPSAPPALHQLQHAAAAAAAAAARSTPLMTTLPDAARLAVHSRNTSSVLRIAPEERRGTAVQAEGVCARLATEHRVKIERSTNKDQWLTIIISGARFPSPLLTCACVCLCSIPLLAVSM